VSSNSAVQILLDSYRQFIVGVLDTNFARILPLIYCQIMLVDFVIYLLALCQRYLMNQILY